MIGQFSPLTRRLIAIGLALLVVLLSIQLIVVPIAALLKTSLADLNASRARLQRLQAIEARPYQARSEPVPSGLVITAKDAAGASVALSAAIGAARQRAGLQALDIGAVPADPRLPRNVAAQIHGVGPMDAILNLANELERGRPLIRFGTWKIEPVQGQAAQLQLTGTVDAAWVNSQ